MGHEVPPPLVGVARSRGGGAPPERSRRHMPSRSVVYTLIPCVYARRLPSLRMLAPSIYLATRFLVVRLSTGGSTRGAGRLPAGRRGRAGTTATGAVGTTTHGPGATRGAGLRCLDLGSGGGSITCGATCCAACGAACGFPIRARTAS